jgi:cytochrome P450
MTALSSAVARAREGAVVWLQRYFEAHAEQFISRLLRRHKPILSIGRVAVVTRRDDVLAVLADPDTFALPYAARLPGPFVLGLSGAAHERCAQEIRAAVRADDLEFLKSFTETRAGWHVKDALGRGGLDVGTDLVHPVLHAVVVRYLGTLDTDMSTQLTWARHLFQDVFLNARGLPSSVHSRAQQATRAMYAHLDDSIAARQEAPSDDVLSRLLERRRVAPEAALTDAEIRNNLLGLAIGWLWHGTKASLIAVDGLLDRPDALTQAQEAASADDLEGLRRVLWEVLRFRPAQAGLPRTCVRETTLAAGTARGTSIRPGSRIFVGTQSAMHDETAIPDPEIFDSSRADGQYLIFGDGLHRCLGERMMRVQLAALVAPLLQVGRLRRADGRQGRLRWEGPHPDGLRVEFARRGA